jgi:hypothetical protein
MPKSTVIDESLLRHIVLNNIRSHRSKFYDKYGEVVIATDNKHYWRRDIFPYYKAHRKRDREASGLNWPAIFEAMNTVKAELKETFPYKFIDVEGAEADDVISVLIEELPYNERALIVSGDKDFIQLQSRHPYVDQYDPVRKRWVTHPNPTSYLEEHIIKGDRGDGIPNIRSDDADLITGKRQRTISAKMLNAWMEGGVPSELSRNYERNKLLIDLSETPKEVKLRILEEFAREPNGKRKKLFNYFIQHRLRNLMENISEF